MNWMYRYMRFGKVTYWERHIKIHSIQYFIPCSSWSTQKMIQGEFLCCCCFFLFFFLLLFARVIPELNTSLIEVKQYGLVDYQSMSFYKNLNIHFSFYNILFAVFFVHLKESFLLFYLINGKDVLFWFWYYIAKNTSQSEMGWNPSYCVSKVIGYKETMLINNCSTYFLCILTIY